MSSVFSSQATSLTQPLEMSDEDMSVHGDGMMNSEELDYLIGEQSVTQTDIESWQSGIDDLDVDGDGKLSYREAFEPGRMIFDLDDKNGDGLLSASELAVAYAGYVSSDETMHRTLEEFVNADSNQSNKLEVGEAGLTQAQIDKFDTDGDGALSIQEVASAGVEAIWGGEEIPAESMMSLEKSLSFEDAVKNLLLYNGSTDAMDILRDILTEASEQRKELKGVATGTKHGDGVMDADGEGALDAFLS